MTDDISARLNQMTRQQKQEVLERLGYACYDHEDEDSWDVTIRADIESGDLDIDDLDVEEAPRPSRPSW